MLTGGAKALITSRANIPSSSTFEHLQVPCMEAAATVRLTQAIAPSITKAQAEFISNISKGVPLLVRLLSDAVTHGRLTIEVSKIC